MAWANPGDGMPDELIDKWAVLRRLEQLAAAHKGLGEQLRFFCAVWNTDDERSFDEWLTGVEPYSLADEEE